MSSTLRLGLAAAVVVAVAIGGTYFLGSRSNSSVAGPETPSPSVSAPAGNRSTFTSTQYGYSVEYPAPYAAVPATEAWTGADQLDPEAPFADRFFAPNSSTFVLVAALQKPGNVTDEAFAADYQQQVAERAPCAIPLDGWTDATVAGVQAQRAEFDCGGSQGVEIIWVSGDTGYVISGEPEVVDLMAETFTAE